MAKSRNVRSNNPKVRKKEYLEMNVYEKAKDRIRELYQEFDKIIVSSSFGKDSTVVFELVAEVAAELNRLPVDVVFFDEEMLTHHTADFVKRTIKRKEFNVSWYCLPIKHRNACSNDSPWWYPWDERKKDVWVRELPEEAITYHPDFKPYEDSIPKFMQRMYPMSDGNVCVMTGVRAQESLRRYTIVMNKRHRNYVTVSPEGRNVWTAHPIYDWQSTDVWHYINKNNFDYNKYYDVVNRTKLHGNFLRQRLCAPLGEEPLRGLWMYKHIDPSLYNAMLKRVPGVATAARYANTELYAVSLKNPPEGQTWQTYLKLIIDTYESSAKEDVRTRINKMITRHFKQSILEIPESQPDVVSGCSWKFLCQIALRGDFKGRTQSKMTSLGKRTLKKLHITLEQAIETYGTEQYKREMKSRLKGFGLKSYDDDGKNNGDGVGVGNIDF